MSSADVERWVADAWAVVDPDRLRELVMQMVDIPSPTGEERDLAEFLSTTMAAEGIDATSQLIDDAQANAVGRLEGAGDGPSLLLYAPIDTLSRGSDDEVPWLGPSLRDDMRPRASSVGDFVVGLGANNPKGHAACIVEAVRAVGRAGIPLRGDVIAGFGAGGMPTQEAGRAGRRNIGQGVGCSFLLEQGTWADFALIAKPGWSVAHEEVGLCWFDVEVHGTHGYVGARHRAPYHNAINQAGLVVEHLEQWFEQYAALHTDGYVTPQGAVGAILGGRMGTPSFTPAVCRIRADLRISPRTTPMEVRREFGAAMAALVQKAPELRARWKMVLAIPGSSTPEESWIVQSAIRAWERVEGRPHEVARGTSGATDANILRNRGIPTARIGMARIPELPDELGGGPPDFQQGMNTVDLTEMVRVTQHLIGAIVDTCTRTTKEVGMGLVPEN